MDFHPMLTKAQKFDRHAAALGELDDAIPDGALLGFHRCDGTRR